MVSAVFWGKIALRFNNKIVENKVRPIGVRDFIVNAESFISEFNFLFG